MTDEVLWVARRFRWSPDGVRVLSVETNSPAPSDLPEEVAAGLEESGFLRRFDRRSARLAYVDKFGKAPSPKRTAEELLREVFA